MVNKTIKDEPKLKKSKVKEPKAVSDFNEMSDDDFLAWSD